MPAKTTASLLPEDHAAGGAIPEGDYTMKSLSCILHDYNGHSNVDVPAIQVIYTDEASTEYEQRYKAGDCDHLMPSEDGHSFVHPKGEAAAIYKGGAASQLIASLLDAGFPRDKVSGDVTVFAGTKVTLVNKAAPKGRSTGKEEAADRVIPLVGKILALPGEAKGKGKATARPAAAATPKASTSPSSNGLVPAAIEAVQAALANAPDNHRTRVQLGTDIMLALSKAKVPDWAAIKKLASDPQFLIDNAVEGGWVTDGDTVQLG